jgi:membrane dipeptidase
MEPCMHTPRLLFVAVFALVGCADGSGDGASRAPSPASRGPEAPVVVPPPRPEVAPVVDLHTDTATQLYREKLPLDAPSGLQAGLVALRAGGVNTVVYALWPPRDVKPDPYVFDLQARLDSELRRLPEMRLVRDPVAWREVLRDGHIAVILGLEGAHGLEPGGLPTLDRLYDKGVRVLGLTWSFSNRYAGSSGDGGAGLTEEGRRLLARANDLGMLVDVSHASDAATLQACRLSRAPVIASHSNADGVRDQARNLSDEAIRCIAERGGVIGLNLHATFVARGTVDIAAVAAQALYLARIGGSGVVALGSDFDGYIRTPVGLPDEAHVSALWRELAARGVDDATLAAWKGGNFARTWDAAWAARRGDATR